MDPNEAIKKKKIKFWVYDAIHNSFKINTNHMWYYQIQGQLHVTRRNVCLFGVWTGTQHSLKIEYVSKDDNFWKDKMETPLKIFYLECILPELVDPRHTRNMPIRDPCHSELKHT